MTAPSLAPVGRRRPRRTGKALAAASLFALLLTALGGCPCTETLPTSRMPPGIAQQEAPAPATESPAPIAPQTGPRPTSPAVPAQPISNRTADAEPEGQFQPPPAPTSRQVRSDPRLPADLPQTLQRISAGRSFPHRNDGAVFQNRERRLPRKPEGYYHEYVHPTPGEHGPGAQRVILGDGGEIYYTPDHYRTFIRVDRGSAK